MTPVLCVGRNKHGHNSRITSTVYPGRRLVTYLKLKALCLLYIPPGFTYKKMRRSEYLLVLYGSQNKQRLFPCTALNGWFW